VPPAQPVGSEGLEPLVHDEQYIHTLIDVEPERLVYVTSRRNGVDFDVMLRSIADGTETVAYDAGGNVRDLAVAPGRTDGVGAGVRELTGADEHAHHEDPQ
jgi:hypothetical protein